MTTRLSFSNGLPPRISAQAAQAFLHLDCTEPPLPLVTKALGEFARTYGIEDSAPIERMFSLLVAANHASDRLTGPPAPLPTNAPESLPSPTEWLLLASRERALAPLPEHLGRALDAVIAELDAPDSPGKTLSIVDYSLGAMFAAIAQKGPDSSEFVVGNALGKLARLMMEVLLAARPAMPVLRPILLRFVAGDEARHLAARLDTAVAMACKPVPDKLPLLSFFGNAEVRSSITRACASWRDLVVLAIGETNPLAVVATSVRDGIVEKLSSLRLFGFAKPPSLEGELDRAITLAVEALCADPELREAWEIQRWGGPFPRACVGRFFPVGLCTLALTEASVDTAVRIEQLMSLQCVDGFRYFDEFPGIAPDADDLGLALQLAARSPRRVAHLENLAWPVEVLVGNTLPDGEIPVWLEQHLREPRPPEAPVWRGSRCLAVATNAVIGLLEARVALPTGYIERAIDWIARTWKADGMRAVFFYSLPYVRFVMARLRDVACARMDAPEFMESVNDMVEEMEDAILSSKDLGTRGSVLETACNLAALACGGRRTFEPWPLVTHLVSRQEHDGLWPSEPLYPTPGKDYASGSHGSRSISAGLCLYALARTRRRLSR